LEGFGRGGGSLRAHRRVDDIYTTFAMSVEHTEGGGMNLKVFPLPSRRRITLFIFMK